MMKYLSILLILLLIPLVSAVFSDGDEFFTVGQQLGGQSHSGRVFDKNVTDQDFEGLDKIKSNIVGFFSFLKRSVLVIVSLFIFFILILIVLEFRNSIVNDRGFFRE